MCSKFAFHVISPFLWQESHVDAVVETARLPTDSLAAPGGPPLGAAVSEPVHEPVHEAPPEEPVPEAPEPRDLTQTFEEYQSQLLFPNDGHDFGEASADKNIPNAIENGEGCPNAAKPSTPIEPEHPAPKDTLYIQWGSRCVCFSLWGSNLVYKVANIFEVFEVRPPCVTPSGQLHIPSGGLQDPAIIDVSDEEAEEVPTTAEDQLALRHHVQQLLDQIEKLKSG